MSGDACSFEWLVMVLLKTAYFFGPVLVLVLSRHVKTVCPGDSSFFL